MPRRIIAFVILAAVLAAVFVRLGFWQLDRLADRRASNDAIRARLANPAVPITEVRTESLSNVHRRVVVEGNPEFANEFVLTGRSRNGSPGVHIITPVRGKDGVAVLVNRGWVYAADAATADLARWRERRTTYHGYTMGIPYTIERPAEKRRSMRALGFEGIYGLVPPPVNAMYVVAQDSGHVDSIPARLPMPVFNNGPHLNYAIQWFAFAAIAIAGAVIVARKSLSSS